MDTQQPVKNPHPKLFISYSWSSPEHVDWVLQLATQLREAGIDVILDKWDLREGHDATAFMEKMVNDLDIKKVAMICDQLYAEKANGRAGGVGTETQIISPAVYEKQDQNKFVAIIAERDEAGKPFLPTYYKSRIYIDLSSNDHYAENFEQLVRWAYDAPLYVKPELGPTPAFLEAKEGASLGTSFVFQRALDAIKNNRPNAKGASQEYFNLVAKHLERFRIVEKAGEFDDQVVASIESFLPYRNEASAVFEAIAQYSTGRELQVIVHRFFEMLIPYMDRPEDVQSSQDWDRDNFKFIIQELFLCCIAILLKYEAFDVVAYLLDTGYYVRRTTDYGDSPMLDYTVLRNYVRSLDYRNERLQLRRLSLQADLLSQRAAAGPVTFSDLMQADFFLYLRDAIRATKEKTYCGWFPDTLLYVRHGGRTFEIFARAESKTYFDLLLPILNVARKEDILPFIEGIQRGEVDVPRWQYARFSPAVLLGFEKLATKK